MQNYSSTCDNTSAFSGLIVNFHYLMPAINSIKSKDNVFRNIHSPTVVKSDEHSAPDRWARVRGSPNKTPPCTLMARGACKIFRGCNV